MPAVSQIAVELIGRHRIRGAVKLAGGYTNKVWRVFCDDGDTFIVKQYRSRWTCDNEHRALTTLGGGVHACPTVFARSATVLIWRDDGLVPTVLVDEALCRSMGYWLGRIHQSGILALEVVPPAVPNGWRTGGRIIDRARRHISLTQINPRLTHGDPSPSNVLVDGLGQFARFCDFEEFGLGDPRADFLICLVDTAAIDPIRASDRMLWIAAGYLSANGNDVDFYTDLINTDVALGFAAATIDELFDWATLNAETDLAQHYQAGRDAVQDGMACVSDLLAQLAGQ